MNLVVARSWRTFGKQQAVGLLSLYKKIWFLKPQFHLVINGEIDDRWVVFVNTFIEYKDALTFYTTNQMDKYSREEGVEKDIVDKFSDWKWIYHIILYHYLYNKLDIGYLLTYDDDILFNNNPVDEVVGLLHNKVPFAIGDQTATFCDKALFGKLCIFFKDDFDLNLNYWLCYNQTAGLNSGFMGLDLSFFSRFVSLGDICSMFSFKEYKHSEPVAGLDMAGFQYMFEGLLEEQSFLCVNNKAFSNQTHITLTHEDGYDIRYYEIDENYSNSSKIEHYIGYLKYSDTYKERIIKEFNALRNVLRRRVHISKFTYNCGKGVDLCK
jgi:hypothetical protein